MKKLMTLALLVMVFQSYGQGFEGTIKWSMKMDISDPKSKADMEAANKKLADPANAAKIKELQEKMNDPQMKAMMDANPAMKAQMETMIKNLSGAGAGGGVSSMVPSGFTIKMKGASSDVVMEGGMMGGTEILNQADKDQRVKLDRAKKTYTILPNGANDPRNTTAKKMTTPKFTKTGETTKILGYNCTKYTAEMTDNGKTVTEAFWTTTEIKDIDFKALAKQRLGQDNRAMIPEGLEGIPLRIETSVPEGKMVMEVTEIKKESFSASDFTIPSDFKEVKMGAMMGRP